MQTLPNSVGICAKMRRTDGTFFFGTFQFYIYILTYFKYDVLKVGDLLPWYIYCYVPNTHIKIHSTTGPCYRKHKHLFPLYVGRKEAATLFTRQKEVHKRSSRVLLDGSSLLDFASSRCSNGTLHRRPPPGLTPRLASAYRRTSAEAAWALCN